MTTTELGTLERVDVRKAWTHEAHKFTPWLAENLSRLSSELGVELELEDTEVYVGPYRADIVARVPQTDEIVLIENQLEWANLQHLGQVLAYLAGLEAQIVVWVATGFHDEHLSAIRWLNEHTLDPFAFFAVQVGVVRIGDSRLAPVIDVLERPNEWNRQVQKAGHSSELTRIGRFRRDFWNHVRSRRPAAPIRKNHAGSTVRTWVEESNLRVVQYVGTSTVGVYLAGNRGETDEEVLRRIDSYRRIFAEEFGAVDFSKEENPWCSTKLESLTRDRSNWDPLADWLDDQRLKYEEVLRRDPGTAK